MSQRDPNIITGSTLDGGTGMQAVEDSLKANNSSNSGASAPSYAEDGTPFYDTDVDCESIQVDGVMYPIAAKIQSFADGDTTPSVAQGIAFKTANTSSTTITSFDDGYEGQKITVRAADANTIIDSGLTKTGMEIPLVSGDVLEWVYDGSSWKQIAGTVGMGQFVALTNRVELTDWIPASTTSWDDVDVSDAVRLGCNAIHCTFTLNQASDANNILWVRKNGSTANGAIALRATALYMGGAFVVGLDDDAIFEAYFQSSVSSTECYAIGYYI